MNKNKYKGFTIGLAVIIVASMLIISVSMSSLLTKDLKNSIVNTDSVITYQLAESLLNCAIHHDNEIRYFSGTDISDINDESGIFPKNMKIFDQTPTAGPTALYAVATYNGIFTPGYANKNYQALGVNNKTYQLDSISCFGVPVFKNINGINSPTSVSAYLNAPPTSPFLNNYVNGVVTEFKLSEGDIESYTGIKEACVQIDVYSRDGVSPKLFVSRAALPCGGNQATERVLVQYSN